jgi:hypothetical protein
MRAGHNHHISWRIVAVIAVVGAVGVTACSDSDGPDDDSPSIGGINGPAVVDPSFDPFVTDPSAPPATDGG